MRRAISAALAPPAPSSHRMRGTTFRRVAQQTAERRVFWIAVCIRLGLWTAVLLSATALNSYSRDIPDYHRQGREIAESFRQGTNVWSNWIDEGWFEFIGLTYYLFDGPAEANLSFVVLLNALACGLAAVLTFRIGLMAFDDFATGAAAAWVFAVFPGAVFFHAMPIKEAAGVLAVTSVVYGILCLVRSRHTNAWIWIACGLAILAMIRIYLVSFSLLIILISLAPTPRHTVGGYIVVAACYSAAFCGTGLLLLETMKIETEQSEAFQYLDVERLNAVRGSLVRGSGRMYSDDADAQFGEDLFRNAWLVGKGLFHFVINVDMTQIRSERQALAIPEALILIAAFPSLICGILAGIRYRRRLTFPVIAFFISLMCIYGTASTNLGAMYRWRLQVLPMLLLLVFFGARVRGRGIFRRILSKFEPAAFVR